jgi:DNA modification methylase
MSKFIHGDILEKLDEINEKSIDVIFTSPPYWKGFQYESYFNSYKQYLDWCEIWIKSLKDKLTDDGYFLLNIANDSETTVKAFEILNICLKHWKLCDTIIWFVYNRQPANTDRQLTNQHEYIFLLRKHSNNIKIHKERIIDNDIFITKNIGNVWKIPFKKSKFSHKKTCGGKNNWGHSGFNDNLCDLVIDLFTEEGQTVMDCFAGYCSLGISCNNKNRHFIGIEKDDEIFKIAEERLKSVWAGK